SLAVIPYEAAEKDTVVPALATAAANDDDADVRQAAYSALSIVAPEIVSKANETTEEERSGWLEGRGISRKKAARKTDARQTLRRGSVAEGDREAFGVRASLAPLFPRLHVSMRVLEQILRMDFTGHNR